MLPGSTSTVSSNPLRRRQSTGSLARLRSYAVEDQQAVVHLYYNGLIIGELDANDSGIDLDYIDEAYFANPRDHLWVAEHGGDIVGMIAVAHERPGVALVRRLRVAKGWQESDLPGRLIARAIEHCRQIGSLKVVFDTHIDPRWVHHFLNARGYQYTRSKQIHGKELPEFYVNLYHDPERDEAS